jgi:hypothetical protein
MVLQPHVKPGNRSIVLIHELEFKPVFMPFTATLNDFIFRPETGDTGIVADNFHANSLHVKRLISASYASTELNLNSLYHQRVGPG